VARERNQSADSGFVLPLVAVDGNERELYPELGLQS
jgi:hypothetical protein